MKKFAHIFLFIAIVLLLSTNCFAYADEWQVSREDWVIVHHREADAANVQAILDAVYFSYPQISENLGLKFTGTLDIYLTERPSEFGELTDWKLPKWAQGVALTRENKVVLKSPKYSGTQIDLAKAAVHEFVHIMIANDVGGVPLWLNEGLAVMLSGEGYFDNMSLPHASLTKSFIPFSQLENVLKFDQNKAQLAYQQSLAGTQYLVEQFGWQRVSRLLLGIKAGIPYDKAFFEATGLWPDEFENEWLKNKGGTYKFYFLRDFSSVLWYTVVPILFISAVVIAFFRHRRIKRRWKEEEGEYFEYGDFQDY